MSNRSSFSAVGVAAAFVSFHQHYRISFFWSGGSLPAREALARRGSLATLGGLALLKVESRFRRLKGYKEMPALLSALDAYALQNGLVQHTKAA